MSSFFDVLTSQRTRKGHLKVRSRVGSRVMFSSSHDVIGCQLFQRKRWVYRETFPSAPTDGHFTGKTDQVLPTLISLSWKLHYLLFMYINLSIYLLHLFIHFFLSVCLFIHLINLFNHYLFIQCYHVVFHETLSKYTRNRIQTMCIPSLNKNALLQNKAKQLNIQHNLKPKLMKFLRHIDTIFLQFIIYFFSF